MKYCKIGSTIKNHLIYFMKLKIFIILVLLSGCVTAPLKEHKHHILKNNISKKDVMMSILNAFRFTCWKVDKIDSQSIAADCDQGNYFYTINSL